MSSPDWTSLADLPSGQRATVRGLRPGSADADAGLLRRLAEIGFVAGEPVRLLRRGPGGREPIAVQVGDTLFAGSIGRTDLPGGDDAAMVQSLARLARDLGDDVRVLPGHGPETTVGRDRHWMERIARAGRLLIPG